MDLENKETIEVNNAKSAWFYMSLVAVLSIMIGFASGYAIGFNNGLDMPVVVTTDSSE